MAYTKQDFQPNTTLYASELNAMDDQIALNETNIGIIDDSVSDLSTRVTNMAVEVITNSNNIATHDDRINSLETNVAALDPNASSISLSKHKNVVFVTITGLVAGTTYTLETMRRSRTRSTVGPWTKVGSYGYSLLVGASYGQGEEAYGEVASWMQNGGYLESSFSFTPTGSTYTLEINLKTWLLDMVKPLSSPSFSNTIGEEVLLMGQPVSRPTRMLPFTFYLYDTEGSLLVKCNDVLYINGCQSTGLVMNVDEQGMLDGIRATIR